MSNKFPEIVIITGAGQGLGKEVALSLAEENVQTLLISKTKNCKTVAKTINKIGVLCESLVLNIADLNDTENEIMHWISQHPNKKIGIVLCASRLGSVGGVLDSDLDVWLDTYKTNVLGNLAVIKGLIPNMLSTKFGKILFLAGGGSCYGYPLFSGYSLSKTATVREAENLWLELKDKGDFSVACLSPGAMDTKMLEQVKKAGAEVKTTVDIQEPVDFIKEFLKAENCSFNGKLVHVRDDWKKYFMTENTFQQSDVWNLRRIQ